MRPLTQNRENALTLLTYTSLLNQLLANDRKVYFKMKAYQFTNSWFDPHKHVWDQLFDQFKPTKILEIGSFEGASTCYIIEKLGETSAIEVQCIDTWTGGVEHQKGGHAEADMKAVEERFVSNTSHAISKSRNRIDLTTHKMDSCKALAKLLADHKSGHFDFIYIDGSHQAPDVLSDAVLSYQLLRKNGIMVFDDYLWQENFGAPVDPIRCPKIAIDAFSNIYCRKIKILHAPLNQLYIQKIAD